MYHLIKMVTSQLFQSKVKLKSGGNSRNLSKVPFTFRSFFKVQKNHVYFKVLKMQCHWMACQLWWYYPLAKLSPSSSSSLNITLPDHQNIKIACAPFWNSICKLITVGKLRMEHYLKLKKIKLSLYDIVSFIME